MSALLELAEKIQETQVALRQFEAAILEHPGSPSVSASLRSMQKRMKLFEEEFARVATNSSREVARYRVFDVRDDVNPTFEAFAQPVLIFQKLYSVVYKAIKERAPVAKATLSDAISAETSFGLAYTYSGSIGAVLTLQTEPGQLSLIDEPATKAAIGKVLEMTYIDSSDAVRNYARDLGEAAMRLLYRWAGEHVQHNTGADINWLHDDQSKRARLIQSPEFKAIRDLISKVGDKDEDTVSGIGKMIAFDFQSSTFKLELRDEIIGGKVDAAFAQGGISVQLPKEYHVKLKKTIVTRFDREENDVIWSLLGFDEAG